MYKIIFFLSLSLLFSACNIVTGKSSSKNTQSTNNDREVSVFTLAPLVDVVVKDANGQVAHYDANKTKYIFDAAITYPLRVSTTSNSFVDIDFDNNSTAMDAQVLNYTKQTLQSFCNSVNMFTNLYYTSYKDNNISTQSFLNSATTKFNANICADPTQDEALAKVLFAAYNHVAKDGNLSTLDDVDSELFEVENFFNTELSALNVDKIKYYAAYDFLVNLDKHISTRLDTLHKPQIPTVLRGTITPKYSNSSATDVFDILLDNLDIYVAAGHEELVKFNTNLTSPQFSGATLLSFGNDLYMQTFNTQKCLFLANSKAGTYSFKIGGAAFQNEDNITSYRALDGNITNFTDTAALATNGYISSNESKRLLGISTEDKGYYLLNIKDIFDANCSFTTTIKESSDMLLNEQNGSASDAMFRDDGTYLYIAKKSDGIVGYKTDILDKNIIKNSQKQFVLKDNQEAYKLKLVNNDNELFVTTDKGVLVYDVDNSSNQLTFVNEYTSEGAQKGYAPSIDFYNDFLIFTDGFQGVKILKLDNNNQTSLCGLAYFAPQNQSFDLAKTTSVKYNQGDLFVGISSYGIVELDFNDLLFKHCK